MDLLEFTLDVRAEPTKQSLLAYTHFYFIDWEISGVIAACFFKETTHTHGSAKIKDTSARQRRKEERAATQFTAGWGTCS